MKQQNKTTFLALTIFALTTMINSTVLAKDSMWKLCKGTFTFADNSADGTKEVLLANLFEHRNSNGDGRETDLTLIYGANVLSGSFNSTNWNENKSEKIVLDNEKINFTGAIVIDYVKETMNLNGKLNLPSDFANIKTQLKCKTVQD